jgi:hypothetical protein
MMPYTKGKPMTKKVTIEMMNIIREENIRQYMIGAKRSRTHMAYLTTLAIAGDKSAKVALSRIRKENVKKRKKHAD